jgi:hypothetical protein
MGEIMLLQGQMLNMGEATFKLNECNMSALTCRLFEIETFSILTS